LTTYSNSTSGDAHSSDSLFDLGDENNLIGQIHHLINSNLEYSLVLQSDAGTALRTEVKIPDGWERSDYCRLIIKYLYSKIFKDFSPRHKKSILSHIQTFFDFLTELDKDTDPNTTSILFPKYFHHVNLQYSEYTNFKRKISLRRVLLWAKDETARGNPVEHWNDVTRKILKSLPDTPPPRSTALPSSSEKVKTDVDDYEFFLSTRSFFAWYLLKMQALKEEVLRKDISLKDDILKLAMKRGLSEITNPLCDTFLAQGKYCEETIDLHSRIKKAILEVSENNLMLLEYAYFRNYSVWMETNELINNHLQLPNITIDAIKEAIGSKFFALGFSFSELLAPSISEVYAMSFFLATDRIQSSGQDQLTLDQCKLTQKGVQVVGYEKARSSGSGKSTAIYSKNTVAYAVYSKWKESMEFFYELQPHHIRLKKFIPLTTEQIRDQVKYLTKDNLSFYLPQLFSCISRNTAISEDPRTKLLLDSLHGKIERANSERTHKGVIRYQRRERVLDRLGHQSIAQSRALLEQKPISNLSSSANDEIDANLSAHSAATKKNIYKDRTTSNTVLKAGRDFSKGVSQKMIDSATSVSSLLKGTSILTLKQVEEVLGLNSQWSKYADIESINRVVVEAEKRGYSTGTFAELSHDGQTIIICTPMVAAFIQGEINHIDKNIDGLFSINPQKVDKFKLRKLFLAEVLKNFPRKVVKDGINLLSKYNFPYPPLS